jgi:hypothetical protein
MTFGTDSKVFFGRKATEWTFQTVGGDEVRKVRPKLVVAPIVVALDGGILDGLLPLGDDLLVDAVALTARLRRVSRTG